MNTLHLVFHPNLAKSRANRIWKTHLTEHVPSIAVSRDMYAECPNFTFDVAHEQALLVAHEQIILQFPLYWYAPPPLLKKWLDDVILHGFAYGKDGDKLADKTAQLILSAGGSPEAYAAGGANHFTISEFLRPLQQTIAKCNMHYPTPLCMHSANTVDEAEITRYAARWADTLNARSA